MFIRSLALMLILVGCAKENVPATKPVEVSLKGSGDCLSEFSDTLSKYQRGELSDGQISEFWACTKKAVADYQRLTAGDKVGGYSPAAIRNFFQRYFFKDTLITDPLLASIMEVKRVLVAGDNAAITSQELTRAQDFLSLIQQISVDLNPHVKTIFMHAAEADDAELQIAGAAAEKAFAQLGAWLDAQGQGYGFAQMGALVTNLRDFSRQGVDQSKPVADIFATLDKILIVLPDAKQILLSGKREQIAGGEWSKLSFSLAKTYRALLAVRYVFQEDLSLALTREALPAGLVEASQVLEQGVRAHPDHQIALTEWHALFEKAQSTGWLKSEMTTPHLEAALSFVLDRLLAQGQGAPAVAMTEAHLAALKDRLQAWGDLQRQAASGQITDVKFLANLRASPPLEWDDKGRLVYPFHPATTWTALAQKHMAWPYVLMNWVKEAYVGTSAPEMAADQMTTAAHEILIVMHNFGWLTSTQDKIGIKLLREGDLFTLASNGNGLLDVGEAARYVAAIASSYSAAKIWRAQSAPRCPDFEADCVRLTGADPSLKIFASMPKLEAWLAQSPEPRRLKAYALAGEETVLGGAASGSFQTGDMLQVWMIFQYVETFLRRFDTDYSESINLGESQGAFGLFGPILEKMLSGFGLPQDELFGFFTFLMKYGDTPFTMYGGQVLYNHWKWHRNDWAFESRRTELMGILNQLSKL